MPAASFIPCPLCGSKEMLPVSERSDSSIVTRCLGCKLEFVNPTPEESATRELYELEENPTVEKNRYYENYIRERKERLHSYQRVYRKRLNEIERLHPEKGRILDIGCAAGFFLDTARERGWEPYGVDIVPFFLDFARQELKMENLYLNQGEETGFDFPPMDVITLWDLIEHLRHPVDTIRKLNLSLKTGGLLVIWTPNAGNSALMKGKWMGYDMDQHLYFFNQASLTRLLADTGFEVLHCETSNAKKGFFPPWCSHDFGKKPTDFLGKTLFSLKRNLLKALNPCNLASPLMDKMGYGFNIYVIARKVSE